MRKCLLKNVFSSCIINDKFLWRIIHHFSSIFRDLESFRNELELRRMRIFSPRQPETNPEA